MTLFKEFRVRRFRARGTNAPRPPCAHVVCLLAGDLDGLLDHLWQHWGLNLGGVGLAVSLILAACDGKTCRQAGRAAQAGRCRQTQKV